MKRIKKIGMGELLLCWIVSIPCLGIAQERREIFQDLDLNAVKKGQEEEKASSLSLNHAGQALKKTRYLGCE